MHTNLSNVRKCQRELKFCSISNNCEAFDTRHRQSTIIAGVPVYSRSEDQCRRVVSKFGMGRVVRPSDAVISREDTKTEGTWLWQDVDPVADSILAAKENCEERKM
jgi:hypothetical protein